jgi:hypothetical protein
MMIVRSEGGADCVKLHEASGSSGGASADPISHIVPSNSRTAANPASASSSSSTSASRSSTSPLMSAGLSLGGNGGRYDVGMGMGMMGTKMEDGPNLWGGVVAL